MVDTTDPHATLVLALPRRARDPERLSELTRLLQGEVEDLPCVRTASLKSTRRLPKGARASEASIVSQIVVGLAGTGAVASLVAFLRSWIRRIPLFAARPTITIKNAAGTIQVREASDEIVKELIAAHSPSTKKPRAIAKAKTERRTPRKGHSDAS